MRPREARAAAAPTTADLGITVTPQSEEKLRKHFERLAKLTEKAPTESKIALEGWFGPSPRRRRPRTERRSTRSAVRLS